MFRRVLVLITAAAIVGCGHAYAQETSVGPGVVEVTVVPGGVGFFSSKDGAPVSATTASAPPSRTTSTP